MLKRLLFIFCLLPLFSNAQTDWEHFRRRGIESPFDPVPEISIPNALRPYKYILENQLLTRISPSNDSLKISGFPSIDGYTPYNHLPTQSVEGKFGFIRQYYKSVNFTPTFFKNAIGYFDGTTLKFKNETEDGAPELNAKFTSLVITQKYIWVSQASRILRYSIASNSLITYSGSTGQPFLLPLENVKLMGDSAKQVIFENKGTIYRYTDALDQWEILNPNDKVVSGNTFELKRKIVYIGNKNIYTYFNGIFTSTPITNGTALGKPYNVEYSSNNLAFAYYENGFVILDSNKTIPSFYNNYPTIKEKLYTSASYNDHSYKQDNGNVIISLADSTKKRSYYFSYSNRQIKYEGTYFVNYNTTAYKKKNNDFYYYYAVKSGITGIKGKFLMIKNQNDTTNLSIPHEASHLYGIKADSNYIWLQSESNTENDYAILRLSQNQFFVYGLLFYDFNKNGIQESNDIGVSKYPVVIHPSGLTIYPAKNGKFSFGGHRDSSYTLTLPSDSLFDFVSATLPLAISNSKQNKIGISLKNNQPDINSNFYLPWPRCNTKPQATLRVENTGFTKVEKTILKLYSNSNVELFKNNESTAEDTLVFEVSNMEIDSSKRFTYNIGWPSASSLGKSEIVNLKTEVYQSGVLYKTTYDSVASVIRCSFDPNDKAVTPAGVGKEKYTLKKSTLTYLIRFENTGNDTAYAVTIHDTLSPSLNPKTFRLMGSSHSVQTEKTGNGVLKFTFQNIMLPDSTTNKEKAQGWVRFSVTPYSEISENTSILNQAGIVFDGNGPVITNVVSNQMVTQFPTSLSYTPSIQSQWFYPNPSKEIIYISNEVLFTEIVNNMGQLILSSKDLELNISQLQPGMFTVTTTNKNGVKNKSKLIKY